MFKNMKNRIKILAILLSLIIWNIFYNCIMILYWIFCILGSVLWNKRTFTNITESFVCKLTKK
jgi:hypothetical protein